MLQNDTYTAPLNKSLIDDMRASYREEKNENLRLVEAVAVGAAFVIAVGAIALYLKSKEKN